MATCHQQQRYQQMRTTYAYLHQVHICNNTNWRCARYWYSTTIRGVLAIGNNVWQHRRHKKWTRNFNSSPTTTRRTIIIPVPGRVGVPLLLLILTPNGRRLCDFRGWYRRGNTACSRRWALLLWPDTRNQFVQSVPGVNLTINNKYQYNI